MAVGAGTAFLLQRQTTVRLRNEMAGLHRSTRPLNTLRTEVKRLATLQASPTKLDAMRGDSSEAARLRGEIASLERQLAAAEKGSDDKPEFLLLGRDEWQNSGQATPVATIESVLWSTAQKDIDGLVSLLDFSREGVRASLAAAFAALPDDARVRYGTPERMFATIMAAKITPVVWAFGLLSQTFSEVKGTDLEAAELIVRIELRDGQQRDRHYSLTREDERWRLLVPESAVVAYLGPPKDSAGQ